MKFYISLPIGGFEDTVKRRFEKAVAEIKKEYPAAEIAGPCNIQYFDETGLTVPRDHEWSWYMGEDMKDLLQCTHIYLTQGWQQSVGCRVEKGAAEAKGIIVKFSPTAFMKL